MMNTSKYGADEKFAATPHRKTSTIEKAVSPVGAI